MKKIIRQILDDLNARRAAEVEHRDTPSASIQTGVPKLYEPAMGDLESPHSENEGAMHITEPAPGEAKPGDLNFDHKPDSALPQDLNNQELSRSPAERLRQLDFQAQKDKERLSS